MPVLAGALLGTGVEGAILAAGALAVSLVLQIGGADLPAPRDLFGLGVSILGLLTAGGAAAATVLVLGDRPRRRVPENEGAVATGVETGELAMLRTRLAEAERALAAAFAARDDAESNAAGRARFLANMSHELRTPLNAIMGFSDIMRAKMFGDLPPRYAEYAQLIHESGRHLTDLINDVLDMSKIEADRYVLSRETFDAREAVNAALRLVRLQADDAGVGLRGLSPPEPLMVDADRRALKQIVLNLVSNALKFTPRGGSVTVSAQAVRGEFELTVADTGVGIAKDDLERLGRPFEQAGDAESKAQGTGLGLSLVKAFARLHGGTMGIESELGEGSAVTVRLPVLVEAAGAGSPAEAPPEPPGGDNRPRMGEVIPLNLVR
jgi:cell cycle sensor histidine kinase DivJ